MQVHNYDGVTGIFTHTSTADESPLEKDVYLIPANATDKKPLELKLGSVVVFNTEKEEWEYVEDNRGSIVYDINTKESMVVNYLGVIKSYHTLLEPKETDVWDGQKWVADQTAVEKANVEKRLSDIPKELDLLFKNNRVAFLEVAYSMVTGIPVSNWVKEDIIKAKEKYTALSIEEAELKGE